MIERISAAASVPVYGFTDQYLGRGIVGGSLYSFTAHGADTAMLVLRVLSGGAPSEAISEVSSNKVMFDWRQMQRWSISEHNLPPDAEIATIACGQWTRCWSRDGAFEYRSVSAPAGRRGMDRPGGYSVD